MGCHQVNPLCHNPRPLCFLFPFLCFCISAFSFLSFSGVCLCVCGGVWIGEFFWSVFDSSSLCHCRPVSLLLHTSSRPSPSTSLNSLLFPYSLIHRRWPQQQVTCPARSWLSTAHLELLVARGYVLTWALIARESASQSGLTL